MYVNDEVRNYVRKRIIERGRKELDRLNAEIDKIHDKRLKILDEIAGLNDIIDRNEFDDHDDLVDELRSLQDEIRRKFFRVARKRLYDLGWRVTKSGLDFLLLNDLEDYGPDECLSDKELVRRTDGAVKTAAEKSRDALNREYKRLGKEADKATKARDKYRARIEGAVEEAVVLISIGSDTSKFKKIVEGVRI